MSKYFIYNVFFFPLFLFFVVLSISLFLMNCHMIFLPFHDAYELGHIVSGEVWWGDELLGEKRSVNISKVDFPRFTRTIDAIVQEVEKEALAYSKTISLDVLDFLGIAEKQIRVLFPSFGINFVGTTGELKIAFYEGKDGFVCGIEYRCRRTHNFLVRMSCIPYCLVWIDSGGELMDYIEDVISDANKKTMEN